MALQEIQHSIWKGVDQFVFIRQTVVYCIPIYHLYTNNVYITLVSSCVVHNPEIQTKRE